MSETHAFNKMSLCFIATRIVPKILTLFLLHTIAHKFDCRLQHQFFIRYELQAQVTIATFMHQHKQSLHKCTNKLTTYNCTNKPQKTKLNLLHPNACIKCGSQWKETKWSKMTWLHLLQTQQMKKIMMLT
jgi:hypothetical protein